MTNTADLFDLGEHEAKAEARRGALAEAERLTAEAKSEAKVERVEDLEADMGGGTVTAHALTKARTEAEIATAKANQAASRARMAARSIPNTDTELAEAVAKSIRAVVHHSIPVASLPASLADEPDLSDFRPLVTVVQQEPRHRSERGWLSTVLRPGAMDLNGGLRG